MPTKKLGRQQPDPARRAGWLILSAAAVAAAAAFVDPASFSQSTVYTEDGRLRLEYSRVDHAASATRLRLWVAPGLASDGLLRVRLNQGYTRGMRIERVRPEPERVETGLEDVVFVFKVDSPHEPSTVEFDAVPTDYGRRDGRLAVVGDAQVAFTQYLVP